MVISPERKKWLADRLRKVAAEERQRGFEEIAADFEKQAELIEKNVDELTQPRSQHRPHAYRYAKAQLRFKDLTDIRFASDPNLWAWNQLPKLKASRSHPLI